MSKQDKYTRSAKDQPCQVRIPNVCNHNPETTVLAHLNGWGIAGKHSNIHGAYACSDCHSWLDGGYCYDDEIVAHSAMDRVSLRDLYHLEGVLRTQVIMIKKGVLKV